MPNLRFWISCLVIFAVTKSISAQLSTTLPLDTMDHSFTRALADTFSVEGLQFTPQDTVFIRWDHDVRTFSLYGNALVHMGGHTMPLSLGTLVEPSLILNEDTTATAFQMSVVDTFGLHKLIFIGIPDTTILSYNFSAGQYEVGGDAKMILNNKHYTVCLGSSSSPGVIYKSVGGLQRVVVNVNLGMDLHDLEVTNSSIVLKWLPGNPSNTYYGHGQFSILIYAGYYFASAGTNSNPGITIVNGVVEDVEILVAGGALLFGALPSYSGFIITYNHDRHVYVLNGEVTIGVPLGGLLNLPQLSLLAGSPDVGGIEYHTDTHKFHVDSATFVIRNIGGKDTLSVLGGFQLKNLAIAIEDDVPTRFTGLLILPMGVALDADIQFTYNPNNQSLPFFIHSIGLGFEVTNPELAVPMGETGFFLVRASGMLSGLDHPSQLMLTDTMGFTFGDLITVNIPLLGTQTIAPFFFQAFGSMSGHDLTMGVSGDIGAKIINGKWQGLLGDANVTLDFKFGGKFTMTGTLNMPSDPLLVSSATAIFSKSGDLDLLAKAQLVVPHYIPIIGGKTFGNVDAAFRMKHSDPHNSFAAGWTKINLLFDHVHLGALYEVGTGNIRKVGAAEAENITTTIENETIDPPPGNPQPNYWQCTLHHDFTIPTNKPAAYLQSHLKILNPGKFIDPNPNDGDPNITVTAHIESPDVDYPNLEAYRPADSLNIFPASNGIVIDNDGMVSIHVNIVDSCAWIAANHGAEIYGVIDWQQQPDVLLTPGMHTMILEGWCPLNVSFDEEDISFTTSPAFPRPEDSIALHQVYSADVFYSSYLTDSFDISLFYSLDKTLNGHLLERWGYLTGTDVPTMPGYKIITVSGLNQLMPPVLEDTVYFYVAANDKVNPVVYSTPKPYATSGSNEIHGQVHMEDGTGVANVPVIMFRESNPAERLATYTDANGNYAFYNCHVNVPVIIQVLAPSGLSFTPTVDINEDFLSRVIKTPDWMELTVQLNQDDVVSADFEVTDMTISLYGAIYDTNFVSIPEAWVFLISSGGQVISQQQTTASGFAFYNVSPGNYSISMTLPTDSNGYHWFTADISDGASIKERVDSLSFSGAPVREDYHARSGNGPFFRFKDADSGKSLAGGQIEFNAAGTNNNPLFSITSMKNGLVSFDEQDLIPDQPYDVTVSPPSGYHCMSNACLTTYTWDGFYQEFIELLMEQD